MAAPTEPDWTHAHDAHAPPRAHPPATYPRASTPRPADPLQAAEAKPEFFHADHFTQKAPLKIEAFKKPSPPRVVPRGTRRPMPAKRKKKRRRRRAANDPGKANAGGKKQRKGEHVYERERPPCGDWAYRRDEKSLQAHIVDQGGSEWCDWRHAEARELPSCRPPALRRAQVASLRCGQDAVSGPMTSHGASVH